MDYVGADDGPAIRTDDARWHWSQLGHLQATTPVDQRIPEVYHPAKPTRRADSLDDRPELRAELNLDLFARATSADRCKRAPRGIEVRA